ncbi:hypothetical protein KIN20_025387 [Parelaphostrongylus tenuis]|uniref:Chromo domain-containing protein n=1 Tax=Parelaphostrongylus tenuis TaxID=148309 RepID=A0AAD5QX80_PARTN|nr:hypothetical protein KIN20_025387 [Parelaphostrongylus tenuis]
MKEESYAFKRILKERVVDGKKGKEYLVDWEPSWVNEQDMDARLLDDYHVSVEVLGPIHSPENLRKASIKDMDMVVQRRSRKVSDDEVILELMPYEQVKRLYPNELFTYIESTFSLPEEMCETFEEDTSSSSNSPPKKKKEGSKKRKLSK